MDDAKPTMDPELKACALNSARNMGLIPKNAEDGQEQAAVFEKFLDMFYEAVISEARLMVTQEMEQRINDIEETLECAKEAMDAAESTKETNRKVGIACKVALIFSILSLFLIVLANLKT